MMGRWYYIAGRGWVFIDRETTLFETTRGVWASHPHHIIEGPARVWAATIAEYDAIEEEQAAVFGVFSLLWWDNGNLLTEAGLFVGVSFRRFWAYNDELLLFRVIK